MRASSRPERRRIAARCVILGTTLGLLLLSCSAVPQQAAPRPAPETSAPASQPDAAAEPGERGDDPTDPGWRLVWSDEFDGTELDRSRWDVRHLSTMGDGNLELACLMDRPENVRVADGVLTLTARREEVPLPCGDRDRRFPDGRSYTTGFVETRGKAEFTYGRFEVRARLPVTHGSSKGLWPAFWMRPADLAIGEIDVLEGFGSAMHEPDVSGAVLHAIHHDYDGTQPMQRRAHLLRSGSFADGFHDFAVEWGPSSLRWYVDDRLTYERTPETTAWFDAAFHRPYFLRLNLAVGGTFPGHPDAHTAFPAEYVIESVRVYQR
jgi:beta-glucanase (GH16 family)